MTRQNGFFRTALLPLLIGVLLAPGCGDESRLPAAPGLMTTPGLDLEAADGGFTTEAETPEFGDLALRRSVEAEAGLSEPFDDDAEVRDLARHPGRAYLVTIVWGMLQDQDSPGREGLDGVTYDWSGELEVNRGALLQRSLISFEREDGDSLLRREVRTRIEWQSRTGEGHDGIRVQVIFPPRMGSDPQREDSLVFRAGPVKRVFLAAELDTLDEQIDVDAAGNQIRILGVPVNPTAAHLHGFLRGRWNHIAEGDSAGRFQGVWVSYDGRPAGVFRGIYGTREDSSRVFFGKWIDAYGRFRGLMRGTWSEGEDRPGVQGTGFGQFRGEWVNASGEIEGALVGRWRAPTERPGYLDGRWCVPCATPLR